MTFSNFEDYFICLRYLVIHYLRRYSTTDEWEIICGYTFNCLNHIEGLLKVTGSHILYTCEMLITFAANRSQMPCNDWHLLTTFSDP